MYILNKDHSVTKCNDTIEWGRWMAAANRIVECTIINGMTVSTVFLGIDHNFSNDGAPILFETMIFDGPYDQEQWRYHTWNEAQKHHNLICKLIAAGKDLRELP